MNLAKEARDKVGLFLGSVCTQELFADLLNTPIGTIRGWEQGRRIPRGSATAILLRIIIEDPELMVIALVRIKLRSELKVDIPHEVASEIVRVLMKTSEPSGTQLSNRACFILARRMLRAEMLADAVCLSSND